MSLGWIEDVVKDGKVALQSSSAEKSEVNGLPDVSVGEGEAPPPSTMPNETAIAA